MKIYIITHGKKFAVKKQYLKKATKLFNHSELTFEYATKIKGVTQISVHNKDGSIKFIKYV